MGDRNSEGNGGNDAPDLPAGTDAPDCDGDRGGVGRRGHPGDGDPAPAAAAGLTGTAAGLTAEDLGVKGPRGWVFRHLRFEAVPGALVAVEGASGSGRTCLLLTLTGRMRPTEGRARVGGAVLPRAMASVRRFSALGPVPGVNDLDPALTVAEHLRERELLRSRFGGSPRALLRPRAERAAEARRRVSAALTTAGLDTDALPKGERTHVRDLERLEALRLSVALALIGGPRLLAVDDVGPGLSDTGRAEAWRLLRTVADGGTTVIAACGGTAPEEADTVIRLRTARRTRTVPPAPPAPPAGRAKPDHPTPRTQEDTADALAETRRA